jgi:CubicO group peptidase (beta-lactamase class C family)
MFMPLRGVVKMDFNIIDKTMEDYIVNREISGGVIIVRKKGVLAYKNKWGYSNIATKKPIEYDSIFRICSMTKIIVSVGIMKLFEKGRLNIDDPISKYIPSFSNMRVSNDNRYRFEKGMKMSSILLKSAFFKMDKVSYELAQRDITIRDLLSHSSGLEQGVVGLLAMMKDKSRRASLEQQAEKYAKYVLDFQPGTQTGYSPMGGFDMLTRIIEVISEQNAAKYFEKEIFHQLNMPDTTFSLSREQAKRLVTVYKREKGKLKDVTGTKIDIDSMLKQEKGYISGSGGLYSTLSDYDNLAQMLSSDGTFAGKKLLKPETIKMIHSKAALTHLEPFPGIVWGLGVAIRQNPQKDSIPATEGTYGWSGAFGTHFFISPKEDLSCVWLTNRTDLNGAESYISKKVEELVFREMQTIAR